MSSRLLDGYSDVPPGKIAAVVTSLEMRARPPRRPEPPGGDWQLRHAASPDLDWYRDLYRRVGTPWLWFSRLRLSNEALAALIHDPAIEVHAVWIGDRAEGLVELDFRTAATCEITFFGVTPSVIGTGVGRWLMNRTLDLAWSHPIQRLWLHTCTSDHPGAVAFYRRSGFTPFRRQIEIADDPRLTGEAPIDAAPHVPLIGR